MSSRKPLIAYFMLAFAISWGLALVAAGRGEQYLIFVAMLAGPSIASIALTAAFDGRAGMRELARALTRVRVGRWYALLLVAPAVIVLVLAALTRLSPVFRPSIVTGASLGGVLAYAGIAGFGAGFFEELGWTGYATPRLLARHSWFRAGMMLGIPWAAWHVLPDYLGRTTHGPWWIVHALEWFVALAAFRVLMTWVYRHTRSLTLGMLMHASFTGSQALLWPGAASLADEVVWYGIFALALWPVLFAVTRARDARQRVFERTRRIGL